MELTEATRKKEELENLINTLITKYENETGLKVSNIIFERSIPYTGGFSNPLHLITLKVEI